MRHSAEAMLCYGDIVEMYPHYYIRYILRRNATSCSGVRSDDYEKLVDREVRAAIQRMQAAEDAKQQGLRTWRLPESLKVWKHLPKVETRSYCPQAFLIMKLQCTDDVSASR